MMINYKKKIFGIYLLSMVCGGFVYNFAVDAMSKEEHLQEEEILYNDDQNQFNPTDTQPQMLIAGSDQFDVQNVFHDPAVNQNNLFGGIKMLNQNIGGDNKEFNFSNLQQMTGVDNVQLDANQQTFGKQANFAEHNSQQNFYREESSFDEEKYQPERQSRSQSGYLPTFPFPSNSGNTTSKQKILNPDNRLRFKDIFKIDKNLKKIHAAVRKETVRILDDTFREPPIFGDPSQANDSSNKVQTTKKSVNKAESKKDFYLRLINTFEKDKKLPKENQGNISEISSNNLQDVASIMLSEFVTVNEIMQGYNPEQLKNKNHKAFDISSFVTNHEKRINLAFNELKNTYKTVQKDTKPQPLRTPQPLQTTQTPLLLEDSENNDYALHNQHKTIPQIYISIKLTEAQKQETLKNAIKNENTMIGITAAKSLTAQYLQADLAIERFMCFSLEKNRRTLKKVGICIWWASICCLFMAAGYFGSSWIMEDEDDLEEDEDNKITEEQDNQED